MQPDDVAGRCVLEIDKRMLECQTYLAFDGVKEIERVQQMQKFIAEVNGRCEGMKAKPIPCIPTLLTEESMKQDFNAISDGYKLPLGLTYSEVQPFYLDFSLLGIMGLCGKENTGHKNFVQYVLGAFESNREKYPVRVAIFDDVTRKYECFKNSPIVDTYTLDVEQVADTIQDWHTILSERYNNLIEESSIGENSELLLMIVQNNDIAKKIGDDFDLMEQFNEMISRFKGMNVAIIFSNYHKKVIDKNNATKSSINTIFNKVKSVDASYKDTFSIKKSQLQQWQRYINELSQIVNPRNGKFNAKAMSDAFDGILKQISNDELNSNLEKYVELDKTTGEYTYHWNEIEELFTKDTYSMTDTDYQVLTFILSTMAYENGYIDTENLEKFINCGYTTPSPVTSNDYHTSFEILPNGQKYSYYYIQNKSYMGDTLKTICAMYSNACSVSGNNTNLNALMQAIAENYSVIEWRQKLSPIQMKQDFWSGEITISEETLNNFNKICTPNITLEFVNNTKDGSGLDYYVIKSNASNAGNVLTTTSDGSFVRRNDVSTDNYSDCTLRVYIDCAKNQNSNVVATILNGRSILSEYYQEFDWGQVLTDEAVGLVKQVPVVGNYVSSIYDLGTQAEAIGVISSGLDGIKSADLDDISNISKKTEKRIDAGIGIVNKGLGIYTKYKATEINNQNVQKNQEELEKLSKPLMQKTNLGLVYDTMVVKYDHCTYDDSGKGIKVDGGKDCDKSTCVISPSNYKFDPNVLRKQYDSIMHTTIANEEFAELEKQVKEYITTGNIEEKSILANYVKEWKE